MRSVTSIKGAAAPANPIKVISASELWRCGVALHTEKTAIKCDDAERRTLNVELDLLENGE